MLLTVLPQSASVGVAAAASSTPSTSTSTSTCHSSLSSMGTVGTRV